MSPSPEPLPTPSRRAGPEEVVARYLPELWRTLTSHVTLPPWRVSAQLDVWVGAEAGTGRRTTGSGPWSIELEEGRLSGHAGSALKPLFTVRTDSASFRLATQDVLPRLIRRTNKRLAEALENVRRFADGRAQTLPLDDIRKSPGSVEIRFTDDAGDAGTFHLDIGGGAGPQAVVHAKEDDLWALVDSGGQLQKLLRSRVQVEGAVGWVLRLARLIDGEELEP